MAVVHTGPWFGESFSSLLKPPNISPQISLSCFPPCLGLHPAFMKNLVPGEANLCPFIETPENFCSPTLKPARVPARAPPTNVFLPHCTLGCRNSTATHLVPAFGLNHTLALVESLGDVWTTTPFQSFPAQHNLRREDDSAARDVCSTLL